MAQGLEVLLAALEGYEIQIVTEGAFLKDFPLHWDRGLGTLVLRKNRPVSVEIQQLFRENWEILTPWEGEQDPVLLAEAIAAINRGEIIERSIVGGLYSAVQIQKHPTLDAYMARWNGGKGWTDWAIVSGLTYNDLHCNAWRPVAPTLDVRPTKDEMVEALKLHAATRDTPPGGSPGMLSPDEVGRALETWKPHLFRK